MHTQTMSRAYLRNTPWHALPAMAGAATTAQSTQPLSVAELRRIVAAMID